MGGTPTRPTAAAIPSSRSEDGPATPEPQLTDPLMATPVLGLEVEHAFRFAEEAALQAVRRRLLGHGGQAARLGRFVVLQTLGEGGMGVVYLAHDTVLDRKVALKVIRPSLAVVPLMQARLVREATAMARLNHPNVVQVFEADEIDGNLFIAMEFVPGTTLREWLKKRTVRSKDDIRDVARMFEGIAHGLAAAHRAGLVHRDFKPDNVLIDDDGRPRVVDFGLARDDGFDPHEVLATARSDGDREGASASLTETGFVMGTPAYMAPEQVSAGEIDGRADQFSFAVSMFECLFGERPFVDRPERTRLAAIRAGAASFPTQPAIPGWLRRLIVRGLECDPELRWPSMDAIAAELRAHTGPRRWLPIQIIGATALALTGLILVGTRAPPVCSGGLDQVRAVWNGNEKAKMTRAFESSGAPGAGPTADLVATALDAHAEQWATQYRQACESTHVSGTQSAEVLDLRMGCLRRAKQRLSAIVDVLGTADREIVLEARTISEGLDRLERCEDVEGLASALPLPSDPRDVHRIDAVRKELASIEAVLAAGKFAVARQRLEALDPEGRSIAYPPVAAELAQSWALLLDREARYEDAAEQLRVMWTIGLELGSAEIAADAVARLVYVIGHRQRRADEALAFVRMAWPINQRAADPVLEANLRGNYGAVLYDMGRFQDAESEFRRALEIYQSREPPIRHRISTMMSNVGVSLYDQGRIREALAIHTEATDMAASALGDLHPNVARGLANIARDHFGLEEYDEAETYYRRALSIYEAVHGDAHPEVAGAHASLARALHRSGKFEDALVELEAAVEAISTALGPDHPEVAAHRSALGSLLYNMGRYAESVAQHRRSIEIHVARYGEDNVTVARYRNNLGNSLRFSKDLPGARAAFEASLRFFESDPETPPAAIALVLGNLGNIDQDEGRYDAALEKYRRSLAICDRMKGPQNEDSARARNNICDTLFAQGRPDLAEVECRRALELRRAIYGDEHAWVSDSHASLARTLLAQGKLRAAAEHFEPALEFGDYQPWNTGRRAFELAQVRWRLGQRGQALELAARSIAGYTEAGKDYAASRGKVEAWVRARGGSPRAPSSQR